MTTTVFVSGATGFLAQHIVKELIDAGYSVVGTARSSSKGDGLRKAFGDKFSYEVVEDIQKQGAFDEALKKHPEVSVFLHTASPFHLHGDPEKDLLLPAIEGTKNALAAIKKHGSNVKRVVVTSSFAAINGPERDMDTSFTATEDTWNDITWEDAKKNTVNGYYGSKTFAEKAAWDFVREEKPQWALSVVNPTMIFGPQTFSDAAGRSSLNTSSESINAIMSLKPDDEIPQQQAGWVDVRDVAKAHLVAFEKEDAKGQRLLLNAGRYTSQTILDCLNENVSQLKGKLPKGDPGSDKKASFAKVDNSKTLELLGFKLIDLKKSLVDTVDQLLEARKN
ncbi:putative NADPH-dependent methylglyoxal reductase Grp2p [Diutina catenulata]